MKKKIESNLYKHPFADMAVTKHEMDRTWAIYGTGTMMHFRLKEVQDYLSWKQYYWLMRDYEIIVSGVLHEDNLIDENYIPHFIDKIYSELKNDRELKN